MVNAKHLRSPFLLLDNKRLVRQGNRRYQRALQAYPVRRNLRGRPISIMRLIILCHTFGSCLGLGVILRGHRYSLVIRASILRMAHLIKSSSC